MGLLRQKKIEPVGEYGIWTIEESERYFRSVLLLEAQELAQLNQIKVEERRLEWLASRYLLHKLSGRTVRAACEKDEFGKPHLKDSPYQISISHSRGKAAAIAAPMLVGIDIQHLVPKIERIAHKFMTPKDTAGLSKNYRLEHLHLYWGAKEALYKAYGKKALDFRNHILVHPFDFSATKGSFWGCVKKNAVNLHFKLYYEFLGTDVLVYAIQQATQQQQPKLNRESSLNY